MEEYFITRSRAVQRIVTERHALIKQDDKAEAWTGGATRRQRIEELTRLLFDVRAGRIVEFVLPTGKGEIRVVVSPD